MRWHRSGSWPRRTADAPVFLQRPLVVVLVHRGRVERVRAVGRHRHAGAQVGADLLGQVVEARRRDYRVEGTAQLDHMRFVVHEQYRRCHRAAVPAVGAVGHVGSDARWPWRRIGVRDGDGGSGALEPYSYAPMSQVKTPSLLPSISALIAALVRSLTLLSLQALALPASIAALPLPSAKVWVGPPLDARAPRPISAAVLTVALDPQVASSARLLVLADASVPAQFAPLVPLTRSVFLTVGVAAGAKVAAGRGAVAGQGAAEDAQRAAVLDGAAAVGGGVAVIVLLTTVSVPWLASAPPSAALLPVKVLLLMVAVPRLRMAPPGWPVDAAVAQRGLPRVNVPPLATWNRRNAGVPAALLRSMTAPFALIVIGLVITGRPFAP